MLASLNPRDGQRVAVALTALRRKHRAEAKGTPVRAFIEGRAGGYRLLYRFDRDRIRVALLAHMADSRPREVPRLGLAEESE